MDQKDIPTVPVISFVGKNFEHHHNLAYKESTQEIVWLCPCIPANRDEFEEKARKQFQQHLKQI